MWGCGASRQSESIFNLKRKPFLYYLKGLTGVHLDITIVFTITVNVWEQKQSLCGGMVLADSQKVFPVVKIKPLLPPPCLYYKRVKWSSFIHYHWFYYHRQCLKTKIKFVYGGVVLADNVKYFYFNNKAPPLSLQRVDWSLFRYCHYFYYHSQCLKTIIEFVFGGVVLADNVKYSHF